MISCDNGGIIYMIISHRYKFIFLKTRKTASTSVEIALSKFCGKDDIVTRMPEKDEQHRLKLGYMGARNYQKLFYEFNAKDWARLFLRRKKPIKFREHIEAKALKEIIGENVWNNYFKFSIERNPWDKAISQYYYKKSKTGQNFTFKEFLLQQPEKAFSITNYDIYSINGKIITDYMIRYEKLEEQLSEVGRLIGLPEPLSIKGITAKGNIRKDRRPYTDFIGEEEREIIDNICRREIEEFGYDFYCEQSKTK